MVTLLLGVPLSGRPGRGRPPSYRRDRRIPPALLLLLAAAVLLVGLAIQVAAPDRLADTRLAGPRALVGRACVVVAADLSGSMTEYTPRRQEAIAALFPWLRANLRPDDAVMLVTFTDQAAAAMPLTRVDRLPTQPPVEAPLGGAGTMFQPAVDTAGKALGGRACGAVQLLAVSDGLFDDDPDVLNASLGAAGITRATVLNPDGRRRPYPLDQPQLRHVAVDDLGDADQLSLTFGRAVAELTGQRLDRA